MGHRLSKIYTRTGDAGTTGLGDGARVKKFAPRVHALGDVDELNTTIGLLLAENLPAPLANRLLEIQHDLFDLGGELSIPGMTLLPADAIDRLEAHIDEYNETLPPLKEFILPSGSRRVASCHFARAVCRRVERTVVELADAEPVSNTVLRYLNRLSDLLFVLCRHLARAELGKEVMWDRSRFKQPPT
ncbi:MAG TPA: cob(I)yrinic acid a,c-diamide adenosyltransferase [Gammaproteobacteria bacterium]|nr:cob(I)yrinic acid a,c-diamide adenosyltransferase [Gammaproteobacteria bacterium]